MKYSIDTSALLDGWVRYYPPDVLPDVWTGLDELIKEGHLAATEEVLIELEKRDDSIHKWAKKRKRLFVPIRRPHPGGGRSDSEGPREAGGHAEEPLGG